MIKLRDLTFAQRAIISMFFGLERASTVGAWHKALAEIEVCNMHADGRPKRPVSMIGLAGCFGLPVSETSRLLFFCHTQIAPYFLILKAIDKFLEAM